jgi:hypothetical protein
MECIPGYMSIIVYLLLSGIMGLLTFMYRRKINVGEQGNVTVKRRSLGMTSPDSFRLLAHMPPQ